MSKALDTLRDYVLERREYCIYYRAKTFDPIMESAWSTYTPKSPDPEGTAPLDLPELWLRAEILVANMLATFYGFVESPIQPYGDVYQTHQKAEKIAMLWEYRARQMKFSQKMPAFFRQAIVTGTSVASVLWDIRHDFVAKTRPIYIAGIPFGRQTKRYYEETYNGPILHVLDAMTFWLDPDAQSCDLTEALDCGVDRWYTQEDLNRLIEQGYFSPDGYKIDWEKIEGRYGGQGHTLQGSDPTRSIMGLAPTDTSPERGRKKQVKVTEWWGRYNLSGTRLWIPMVVTIADPDGQKIMLRPWKEVPKYGNNPFNHGKKPFVMMNYLERPFSPWGQGLYEILASTDEAYQVKVNARLKNIGLMLNKMAAYNPNIIRKPEQLLSRPGGLIEVLDDPRKAIMWLEVQDILQSLSAQIFEFRDLLDELSGVNALMRSGSANPGGKTPVSAMEVNAKQQMAGERFKFLVGMMMEQGPVNIADMELSMEAQFVGKSVQGMTMKRDTTNSSPSPEFFEVTPEDLEGKFKYFFVADPMRANEMMKTNQKITIMGLLTNPFFAQNVPQGVLQPWYVAKELLKAGEIPWQEALIPENMALQMELQRFVQQAQQEAAQGAMSVTAPMMAQQQAMAEQEQAGQKKNDKGKPVSPVPGSSVEDTPMLPPVPSQDNPAGGASAPIESGGVMV